MKTSKIIITYGFLLFVFLGCKNHLKEKMHNNFSSNNESNNTFYFNSYKKHLNFFDSTLVIHFPQTLLSDTNPFYTNFDVKNLNIKASRLYYFCLKKHVESSDSIILNNHGFWEYHDVTDTNFIILTDYSVFTQYNDTIYYGNRSGDEIYKNCIRNKRVIEMKKPILDFSFITGGNNQTPSGLDSTYKIFVIDAQPGIYIDTSHLYVNDFLPPKWRHGFSKGIAISATNIQIIYWLTVW